MHRLRIALIGLLAASASAHAGNGVTEEELERPAAMDPLAAAGDQLPFTVGARHERQGMLFGSYGGYDLAKGAPLMEGRLEATLFPRITVRASMTNVGMSNQLKPAVGMLVDVVREADHGVDFAVGGEYDAEGFNTVPAMVTRAALGKTFGETRLQANAAFGLGVEQGERYGDLRLSGLRPVAKQLYAGLDSRARVDLEHDANEPAGELDWDVQAGPVATLAVGRFAVSATGGVSAWKLRTGDTAKVGAMGALGVGAAF